jgi:predicted HTH transcriptional regulator
LGVKLGVKLGVNEQRIFDAIQNNPRITIIELAKYIGISTTSIENNLNKLKNKQLIKREGSDKTGHWQIINE